MDLKNGVTSLVSALDLKGSVSLNSAALAAAFRGTRLTRFRAFVTDQPQTAALRRRLEKLAGNTRDTDVLPVVQATRHLTFHGVLNPSAAGITTKSAISFVDSMCFRVFQEMDLLSCNFFATNNENDDLPLTPNPDRFLGGVAGKQERFSSID